MPTLTSIDGDVVSVHVDRAGTEETLAIWALRKGEKHLERAEAALRAAQVELRAAELEVARRIMVRDLAKPTKGRGRAPTCARSMRRAG